MEDNIHMELEKLKIQNELWFDSFEPHIVKIVQGKEGRKNAVLLKERWVEMKRVWSCSMNKANYAYSRREYQIALDLCLKCFEQPQAMPGLEEQRCYDTIFRCHMHLHQYEDALPVLQILIKKNPHDSELQKCQATCLCKLEKHTEAIHVLKKSIIRAPNDVSLWMLLGKVLLNKDGTGSTKKQNKVLAVSCLTRVCDLVAQFNERNVKLRAKSRLQLSGERKSVSTWPSSEKSKDGGERFYISKGHYASVLAEAKKILAEDCTRQGVEVDDVYDLKEEGAFPNFKCDFIVLSI